MRRRLRTHERGFILISFALLATLVLTLVALVVDLGQLRVATERSQRAADLAALSAGEWLGNPGGRDPLAACSAAIETVQSNLPATEDFVLHDTGCVPFGHSCDGVQREAVASSEQFTITVTYPIHDEDLTESGEAMRAHDGGACERLRVLVEHKVEYAFARVIGFERGVARRSATVRGVVGYRNVRVPALQSLRRFGCNAIATSGQGRILVDAFNAEHPGVIGADSLGNSTGEASCTANTNSSGYVVFAQPWSGLPGIEARGSEAAPGVLGLVAVKVGSTRGVCCVLAGVRPGGSSTPIISRSPVDFTYNPSVRPAITQARTEAAALVSTPLDTLRAQGWVVYPHDDAGWSCDASTSLVVQHQRVVVDCATLAPKSQAVITMTGSDVVLRGALLLGTQNAVRLPNARRVVVAGSTAGSGIHVGGTFVVNDASLPGAVPRLCSARHADASVHGTTVVVLAGPITSSTSSATHLCDTFVYMAGSSPPQQRTEGGTCAVDLPCPIVNTDRGYVSLMGALDWRASNATTKRPDAGNPYEDLALWTESSQRSEIKGQGATETAGVFFTPNARIVFSGQASQDVQHNAQFFAESFEMGGQGTLRLTPNPNDVVPIPVAAYYLIR